MSKKTMPRRNMEGYRDDTAYAAMQKTLTESGERDARVQRLIKSIKEIIDQSGYDLLNRIELRDRKSGRYYR